MTAVLTYVPSYPLRHEFLRNFTINSFGDGYIQTISSEVAYTRANGMGGQSSYKGLNRFRIGYKHAIDGGLADSLWTFFRARLDLYNEPFYFYNPTELLVPDGSGNNTTGRYLVRMEDPNTVLSRELFIFCVFSYAGFSLIETRIIT